MAAQEAIGTFEVNGMIPGHELSDFPVHIVVGGNKSLPD
jgi:hypothetical protein